MTFGRGTRPRALAQAPIDALRAGLSVDGPRPPPAPCRGRSWTSCWQPGRDCSSTVASSPSRSVSRQSLMEFGRGALQGGHVRKCMRRSRFRTNQRPTNCRDRVACGLVASRRALQALDWRAARCSLIERGAELLASLRDARSSAAPPPVGAVFDCTEEVGWATSRGPSRGLVARIWMLRSETVCGQLQALDWRAARCSLIERGAAACWGCFF